jgi:hypothetical protein
MNVDVDEWAKVCHHELLGIQTLKKEIEIGAKIPGMAKAINELIPKGS